VVREQNSSFAIPTLIAAPKWSTRSEC